MSKKVKIILVLIILLLALLAGVGIASAEDSVCMVGEGYVGGVCYPIEDLGCPAGEVMGGDGQCRPAPRGLGASLAGPTFQVSRPTSWRLYQPRLVRTFTAE